MRTVIINKDHHKVLIELVNERIEDINIKKRFVLIDMEQAKHEDANEQLARSADELQSLEGELTLYKKIRRQLKTKIY